MTQLIKVCKNSIVKDLDTAKGIITVGANAFENVDADGDISAQGSFTKTLNENFARLKWFLNHDNTILLGCPIQAKQTDQYLEITGQMNMQKQICRDTMEDYKLYAEHGRTLEHSIGVNAVKRDSTDKRRVLEWKLWEYSTLTSWGANEMTPLLGIKSLKDIPGAIDFMEVCLRKGNYSDERGKQMETLLKQIRSLASTEPDSTTQEDKPDTGKVDFKQLFTALKTN